MFGQMVVHKERINERLKEDHIFSSNGRVQIKDINQ